MATGDIYRMSCVGDWGGSEIAVCTAHVRMKSSGGTPAGACQHFTTYLWSLVKAQQSTAFYWRYINYLSENLTPPVSGVFTTGFPYVGTTSGDPLPFQVAMVVSLRTAYAGRSYRGRMYLPGMSEASTTGRTWLTASVNAIQQYYDDLVAGVGAGGANTDYEWGIWSRKLQQFNGIASTVVRDVPATIRRRRPGVGT